MLITQGLNARNEGRAALLSNIMSGVSSGIQTGIAANSLQTETIDVLGTKDILTSDRLAPRLGDINTTPRGFNNNFNKVVA